MQLPTLARTVATLFFFVPLLYDRPTLQREQDVMCHTFLCRAASLVWDLHLEQGLGCGGLVYGYSAVSLEIWKRFLVGETNLSYILTLPGTALSYLLFFAGNQHSFHTRLACTTRSGFRLPDFGKRLRTDGSGSASNERQDKMFGCVGAEVAEGSAIPST